MREIWLSFVESFVRRFVWGNTLHMRQFLVSVAVAIALAQNGLDVGIFSILLLSFSAMYDSFV